ncbi:MAG: UvrD-helicase domain-containing protein, partial [Candidatus Paceibacterota bacterium]
MSDPKTSQEFEKLYGVLNESQKKAVEAIEGPVMVIAGPGTGKTTILTLRIANILSKTDTAPENILALTFTESGAYAMRRKLLEIIGPAAYRVNIKTFHGFAESVIQENPDYFPRIIGSKIITEAEQIKIIEEIINSPEVNLLRPYGDPGYYVRSVLREISILKRENISPDDLKNSVKGFKA